MKSTTESLSPTRVKLTIEVPFEELKPSLDKAYKTIGAQIQVPGFRKGKVPAAIVDQRIGRDAVLSEAVNTALPQWYSQAMQETELQPLSQPDIDLTKFADGEPIEITAELDVRPELTLPDLSTIEVEVESAEVTDEDVDAQIEQLRDRFATTTDVERAAADGDAVSIDLLAKDKSGEPIEGADAKGLPYTIGSGTLLDGLDEALIGLEKGQEATFASELVGGELKGTEVDVTVTVVEVKERHVPELDEELVQMASEFDTVEELTADVRERLRQNALVEQANEARDLVLDEIVGAVEAPLPEDLVRQEIEARRQQINEQLGYAGLTFEGYLENEGQTVEEFEAELERRVRDSIVAQFVLDQVVADEELGIDDNELSQHIMQRAQQSGQDPNSYIQHIMEHNHVPEMVSEVLRGKALASLLERVTVKDGNGEVVDLGALNRSDDDAESDAEAPADDAAVDEDADAQS